MSARAPDKSYLQMSKACRQFAKPEQEQLWLNWWLSVFKGRGVMFQKYEHEMAQNNTFQFIVIIPIFLLQLGGDNSKEIVIFLSRVRAYLLATGVWIMSRRVMQWTYRTIRARIRVIFEDFIMTIRF